VNDVANFLEDKDPHKPGVYILLNTKNEKVYVGSASKSIWKRFREHRSALRRGLHCNTYLQRAWDKYGEDAFVFVVAENTATEECLAAEQSWIDKLDATNRNKGYNRCPRAGNSLGVKLPPLTEEHKQRIKEYNSKNVTEEKRKKMSEGSLRRWAKPGEKENHLKQMEKRWSDPEQLEMISKMFKGLWENEEQRAAWVAQRKAMWQDPELRKRMQENIKKASNTPECLAKKSANGKRNWQNEEYRNRLLKSRRSEENRKRLSELHKRLWADPEYRERVLQRRRLKAGAKD
jgi:group I intron endonuclease